MFEVGSATRRTSRVTGAVAGFWHIWWIAGVGMLATGLVAVSVHAAGWMGLKPDQTPTGQEARATGDSDS